LHRQVRANILSEGASLPLTSRHGIRAPHSNPKLQQGHLVCMSATKLAHCYSVIRCHEHSFVFCTEIHCLRPRNLALCGLGRIAAIAIAYCYKQRSVVCLSVTFLNSAKMAEPIEMPFEVLNRLGPRNHVMVLLDGSQDLLREGTVFGGLRSCPAHLKALEIC